MTYFLIFIGILLVIFFGVDRILLLAFSRRFDPNPHLKYFTIADFKSYDMDEVTFINRRGNHLKGGFYYDDRLQPHRELIIFSHGIGAGHQAYTHLIMEYVKKGYVVFAYDNTGCALSEGKSIRGIPQAVLDLQDALKYLSKTTYAHYAWILMGHSWGAYSVLRILNYRDRIKQVVSIAPFNDVGEMLGKYIPWIRLFKPFIFLTTWMRFGYLATQSTRKLLTKTRHKTLIVVGEKDDDIPLKGNYDQYLLAQKQNSKVVVHLAINHRHNPYLSFRAESYIIDTILRGSVALAKETDLEKVKSFYQGLDYQWVGEHDPKIISLIDEFIK
jgi:uncharacterized protein